MHARRVCVLISTFNGSQYINEQIQSILNQKNIQASILVRDDGSSDNTVDILREYEGHGDLVLLPGDGNIGVARSFFELLKNSPAEADYISFCDQDDVWYDSKLTWAIDRIEAVDDGEPVLYFSKQEIVDEQLNVMGYSKTPRELGFGNALFECVTPGCTVVINKSARDLLLSNLPESLHMMHDWWMYLVISCFGRIVYDPRPTMKYRQHANNVVGSSTSIFGLFVMRWQRFRSSRRPMGFMAAPRQQALEFQKTFKSQIPRDKRLVLERLVDGKEFFFLRLCLAFSRSIWRQRLVDDFLLRLLIVVNKY